MSRFANLLEQLRNHAGQICMEDGRASYTYGELLDELRCWRSRFDERRIAAGTVVGVRADYSLSAVAVVLALLSRGAVAAMIPRDRDSAAYLVDAHASALLECGIDGSYEWHSEPHAARHPMLDRLVAAGEGGLVIFTSGSAGRPKAALQSIERLLYKFHGPIRCMRTLAFLLFDHIGGLDTLFYTLIGGGTLIVTRRRNPRSILDLIESHRIEVLPTSPSFLRLLCASGSACECDFSSLKIITYGSEPMDPSTLARLNARFPNAEIRQKYGATEIGSPRSVSRGRDSLWLKINRDGVETKVVDKVLWIRSKGTMLGYLNAPSPVDEDGWYCTGDLVDVDGEWVRFCGRAADIINVGGEKVMPTEVEQAILELDFVRDVVVSGEPHALLGQIVTARVSLTTADLGAKEAAKRIRWHCRECLASYKVPVKVDIVAQGFANERQKVQRNRASE